jgi:hypothetical protein
MMVLNQQTHSMIWPVLFPSGARVIPPEDPLSTIKTVFSCLD